MTNARNTIGPVFLTIVFLSLQTQSVYAQTLDLYVEWTSTVTLEESDDAFTVQPQVRGDGEGGFIVSDFDEAQVRLYDRDGSLQAAFGTKGGQAPGSLHGPTEAVRTETGLIVVPDLIYGSVSVFTSIGQFVERHTAVVAPGTNQARTMPGGKVLLVGSKTSAPGAHPLLHVFDPATGTTENSFFPHPVALGSYGTYLMSVGRIADADVSEDGIVAMFALEPVLYVFKTDGTITQRVELPLRHFNKIDPPTRTLASVAEMIAVAESHSRVQNVFWMDEKTVLIQYYDSIDVHSGEMTWNLAAVRLDGSVLFEVTDTPQLFFADRSTGDLFFSHPDADYENEWIVGRLLPSVLARLNAAAER